MNDKIIAKDGTELTDANAYEKLGFKLWHVGMNGKGEEGARRLAEEFARLFNFPIRETEGAVFISDMIEITKYDRGVKGHIGIGTTDLETALLYFAARGVSAREDTAIYAADGHRTFVYLDREINGFAFHLTEYVK